MRSALPEAWDQTATVLGQIPILGERVRYAAALKPLLDLPKTARILEVGCGAGRLLRALDALGYHRLVGSEISLTRLNDVRGSGPTSAELVCSDDVPFAPFSFDGVVSAAVIEHVRYPDRWLSELARVARPGGSVSIVTDTYMWRWLKGLGLYRSVQPLDEAIWPETLIHWAGQAALELVACGGFVNVPDQRGYFVKRLLSFLPGSGRVLRWLNRADRTFLPRDETDAILDQVEAFPMKVRSDRWSCIWSYECYYWFRKK